jgi:hypothetical protein
MPRDGSLILSDGSALFPSRLCANLADGKDAIACAAHLSSTGREADRSLGFEAFGRIGQLRF